MQFRVLGPIEARTSTGALVRLAGDHQRALLALLLARAGRQVPAEVLIDALWPEDQPEHPAAALQSQVHRLRRVLVTAEPATGWELGTRERGYVLLVEPDLVDALRFDRDLAAARTAPPADALRLLDDALGLWQGPAYAGIDVEAAGMDEVRFEAVRLDEAHLDAVESWADAALGVGRGAEVLPRLEAFVREHPLRERARAALMRALALNGRQSAALAGYADYRERIADELGLEPSAAMRRLEVAILRQEVAAPAPEPRVAPESAVAEEPHLEPSAGPHAEPEDVPALPGPGLDRMRVAYVLTRGGRKIAFGTVGSGPPVVASSGWVSSLAVIGSGQDPRSSLFQRLVGSRTLTLYDRFGTGLSPGEVTDHGIECATDELEAVVERVGQPVVLFAMSQAGPTAVTFTARRPELVQGLVLWGTYADGPAIFRRPDLNEVMVDLVRAHWGMGSRVLADFYMPGSSAQAARHLARVLRDSAPPEVAADYLAEVYSLDVTHLLSEVRVPSLVLHYRHDRVIPFAGGQQLAAGLPDCTFLPLEGRWHLPKASDLDRITEAILEFDERCRSVPAARGYS